MKSVNQKKIIDDEDQKRPNIPPIKEVEEPEDPLEVVIEDEELEREKKETEDDMFNDDELDLNPNLDSPD